MKRINKIVSAVLAFVVVFACTDDRDCSEAPSIAGVNQQQLAQDIQAIEEYLDANDISYLTDPSGIRFAIVEPGEGGSPTFCSSINITFTERILGADEIFNFGNNREFRMSGGMFLGWKFGLTNMSRGADYRLFVPSGLAYGETGLMGSDSSFVVPPNTNIEFRIRLNRFQ